MSSENLFLAETKRIDALQSSRLTFQLASPVASDRFDSLAKFIGQMPTSNERKMIKKEVMTPYRLMKLPKLLRSSVLFF